MVQAKHQKIKPKKHVRVKKHGKQTDISEFRSQLDALGLKIIEVTADGNCFFRALADQLDGNEEEHGKFRRMVVQYILKHREDFEPFIEDEVPFDEYCQSMEKDGTWAGHMELQASSLVTRCNICIHRMMSPRWYVRNFDDHGVHMIHLSYHNEEHYNSVRLKEDPCNGPAKPIAIKADANLSTTSQQAKASVAKSKGALFENNRIDAGSIKLVIAGSGCENADKVEEVLQELDGDVDAAIEFLIAEQAMDGQAMDDDSLGDCKIPSQNDPTSGHNENANTEQSKESAPDNASEHEGLSKDNKQSRDDKCSQHDDKRIPRNKVCPCGSRKKYKACCGTAIGRSSTDFVNNHKIASGKGGKERKQGRKGGATKIAPSSGSRDPPDMGALCI
ncbi:OVARIAN TUMOR DOMAIN-containing deubiquitinating enzyme 7 isoform X2 [Telopea speciosissima]|uniref:OVARIAN TUMOR DOMAIN-containing deubiquitinating enzyme 7 isoform X2 n=1 Tax=Telopea speciosissima TaxID=54955 RepID=UPI001CC6F4F8|nr:OVARIAN TUMOR DOMAIN-containing deubiquitinating enzyme 7 isoform X2 [Telopea speciosissima]